MTNSLDDFLSREVLPLNERKNNLEKVNIKQNSDTLYEQKEMFSFVRIFHNSTYNENFREKNSNQKLLLNKKISNISDKVVGFSFSGRKDSKGIPILKRDHNSGQKLRHHVTFIDNINKNTNVAEIIKVKSFKKYNKIDESNDNNNILNRNDSSCNHCICLNNSGSNVVNIDKCCLIF